MNPKLRLLLVALFSVCEMLALIIVVPMVVLAITAYGLLVCVRVASEHVSNVSSLTRSPPPGSYDPAGGSPQARPG